MADLKTTLARWRVPLGFAFGVVALWMARPTPRSLAIGGAVALVGEAVRVWAAGHLEKGKEVTCSGPYRLTRHPLYLGSAVIGVGVAAASADWRVAALVAAYLASTVVSAIRHEEASMRAAFGEQYDAYLASRARPTAAARAFSPARALKNKEHLTVAGLALAWALLAARAVFG